MEPSVLAYLTGVSRQALARDWQAAPVLAALRELETTMAQGFDDLRQAVADMSGEGGELAQSRDAILAAVAALQGQVTTLQQSADALQAQFTAAGQEASAEAAQLQETKSQLDAVEQALNDAAAAANPAPASQP